MRDVEAIRSAPFPTTADPVYEARLSGLPLVQELTPAPDPWALCRRLAVLPRLLFLDSAGGPAALRRYSFVAADPFQWLHARGRRVQVAEWRHEGKPATAADSAAIVSDREGDPFVILAEHLARYPAITIPDLPPFQGGAAGMFGYGLCHHLEALPWPECDEFRVPDLAVGFYDWVLAFNHEQNRAWLVSTGLPATSPTSRAVRAKRRAGQVLRLLEESPPAARGLHSFKVGQPITPSSPHPVPGLPGLLSNFDRAGYLATIRRAIEYIHAGDCFQVNIAQRLLYPAVSPSTPLDLYGRLRRRNPAPFGGLFDLGEFVLASASPERFVRVNGGLVETRPIKGTRPRGATSAEDEARARELLASAKDRAENVMIVDLLRNDLGRVCQYGSVKVSEVCRLESYEYVHHLVSVVAGRLRPECGPVDLLRAAFPGGSVTGAPKVRAMEIITELERVARGPYCGCLGYLGFDGSMDTNILIRTFTVGRGWVQLPVGGGIVADSVPELEYEETWHKARGSLRALE
jgi:para-aminobenzoate synthetase component 1